MHSSANTSWPTVRSHLTFGIPLWTTLLVMVSSLILFACSRNQNQNPPEELATFLPEVERPDVDLLPPLQSLNALSQDQSNWTVPRPEELVKVKTFPSVDRPVPGEPFKMAIELTILENWHINANPASEEYLIPTEVSFNADPPVTVEKLFYPKGKTLHLSFSPKPLSVYEGRVLLQVTLKLHPDTPPDKETELHVKVTFQACDAQRCLMPEEITHTIKLTTANKDQKPKPT